MGLLKLLDASQIAAQIISFLVLFFILRLLLWKRFLKALDDRREHIASELRGIEDSKARAEEVRADYEARLKGIEGIAKSSIEDAVSEGKRIAEEIRENANEEARQIIEKAEEDVMGQIARAREELRDEIVDIAVTAAGKVVEERLTEEGDKKIVENFLNRIDKAE